MKNYFIILLMCFFNLVRSQGIYAPEVGQFGTTAIHKDSSIIVNWANNCSVKRGYQQIDNTSLGFASVGDDASGIGIADGQVVSLGDSGIAILTVENPIYNGLGNDFAVFENSFSNTFLELAFVEVSSDGANYFRFPNYSTTQDTSQIGAFGSLDATNIYNLAGKYKGSYGTPFNLDDIPNNFLLNKNAITHIKIIDVIGNITNNPTFDSENTKINDPWPTPFASSGFDLDGLGVINESIIASINEKNISFSIYPNPTSSLLTINTDDDLIEASIYSLTGNLLLTNNNKQINIETLTKGIYVLKLKTNKGEGVKRIIKN